MRDTTAATDAVWLGGDFTGGNRPMIRATIQHVDMKLYDLGYNVYASLIFGDGLMPPRELPNIKSLKWSRGIDTDIASGTMELYNTAPQPVGTVFRPEWGLDQPGYYTYAKNLPTYQPAFGAATDEEIWQSLVVPDNLIRTYEGYGFDPATCADNDPNLYQTGLWIIKDVEFSPQGLILVTIEDLASILRDQIAFYPVVPKNFYPLYFSTVPKTSGFAQGYTVTKTVDSGGGYDAAHPPPAGWTGPVVAPTGLTATPVGDGGILLNWSGVAAPATSSGYRLTGYQVFIDNVKSKTVPMTATSLTVGGEPFTKGNVYVVTVGAIYERLRDGYQLVGNHSNVVQAHPHSVAYGATAVNVVQDDAPPPAHVGDPVAPVPGLIGWDYTGDGLVDGFKVILFGNGAGAEQVVYDVPVDGGSATRQFVQTDVGALSGYGTVVYPYRLSDGAIGQGAMYSHGWYLNPPTAGAPPHEASPPPTKTATVTKKATATTKKTTTVVNPVEVHATFSDTSNTYYIGAGDQKTVFGHKGADALDDDDASYWLSIGNDNPGRDYAFEWFQVAVPNVEVSSVRFRTVKSGYFAYVSVFAKGVWVHHDAADIIPYNANDPISHNGGNIPYCETVNCRDGEGPYEVTFRASIPGATKIRVTLHNLQDFGLGAEHYRGAFRKIKVFGITSSSSTTTTGGGGGSSKPPQQSAPTPGPVVDDTDPSIVSTYTTYIPPKETPGAGKEPGKYEDYSDIIKLLLAWGGFYWPPNATRVDACGKTLTYEFGPGLYGLKNVDPVLGDQDAGRVWGDIADTGTAGVADLPISTWDKKPLLDCISYVRDIIGFVFYVDETGGAVWRLPNIFSVGNYVGVMGADAGRSPAIPTIDERTTLIDLKAKLSSRNVRERYLVASTDGKTGALAAGYNPNPMGLRRIAGWTDQHFGSNTEATIMADMIALRALMVYRVDTIQIPGYPKIQIDDQVRIHERVTQEQYLHYVRGISSTNDVESGVWTYDLNTNWLGSDPFDNWIFNPAGLSTELQQYLDAVANNGSSTFAPPPSAGTVNEEDKVAKLVKLSGNPAVYITDGITRRHVLTSAEEQELLSLGVITSLTPTTITTALMNAIPVAD